LEIIKFVKSTKDYTKKMTSNLDSLVRI